MNTVPAGNDRKQKVLLVGGAMRSGTTIIHRALCQARNSNPYISESWFLNDLFGLYERGMSRFDMRLRDQLGDVETFEDIIRSNVQRYLDEVSKKYDFPGVLILKHPELTRHFSVVGRIIPGIKFLVVVRDPRDVVASMQAVMRRQREQGVITRGNKQLQSIGDLCRYYASYYEKIFAEAETFGNGLMFVRYEDVVTDPVKTFVRIGAFSGATYEGDEMMKFDPGETQSKYLSRDERMKDRISAAFWSEMYTKDLSADTVGKYKQTLTPNEIREIEMTLGRIGSLYSYW